MARRSTAKTPEIDVDKIIAGCRFLLEHVGAAGGEIERIIIDEGKPPQLQITLSVPQESILGSDVIRRVPHSAAAEDFSERWDYEFSQRGLDAHVNVFLQVHGEGLREEVRPYLLTTSASTAWSCPCPVWGKTGDPASYLEDGGQYWLRPSDAPEALRYLRERDEGASLVPDKLAQAVGEAE